jgi:hypothetical protein
MTELVNHRVDINQQRSQSMKSLILVSVLVVWIILQAWVLPRFGVKT